jgi:hypothetical protein
MPFLFDVIKVSSQILPARVPFFEGEVFPQLLVKELVDGGVGVDTSARIAVPVPNTARCRTLLEDSDVVAKLPQAVNGC